MSEMKIDVKDSAKMNSMLERRIAIDSDTRSEIFIPFLILASSCAPKFCATNVVAAKEMLVISMILNWSNLPKTAQPAIHAEPKTLTYFCMKVFENEVIDDETAPGSPILSIFERS